MIFDSAKKTLIFTEALEWTEDTKRQLIFLRTLI